MTMGCSGSKLLEAAKHEMTETRSLEINGSRFTVTA